MDNVTEFIDALRNGEDEAAELLPLVYVELRKLAARKLADESPGHTLQATALVHEAFLKLSASPNARWKDRQHFLAAAAEAMRRILIDSARRKKTQKHGGEMSRAPLIEDRIESPFPNVDVLALNDALEKLESNNPDHSTLVKLRFFTGLTLDEIAEAMDVPRRSLDRMWKYARVWLLREIGSDM